jgi:hypothetical protein
MSARPRTRFVVRKGGYDRDLLSITEQRNGDLLVLIKHGEHYEGNEGARHRTAGQHYSVHCSPNTAGFTVKHTLSLHGGGQVDTAQFKLPGPDGPATMIFGRTVPDLDLPRYILRARRRDEILRLYDADIGSMTMFYFVLAVSTDFDTASLNSNLHIIAARFRRFQLLALSGFFYVPAISEADLIHPGTSMPRFDPVQDPVQVVPPRPCSRVQEEIREAELLVPILAQATFERHARFAARHGDASGERLATLQQLLSRYRANPLP